MGEDIGRQLLDLALSFALGAALGLLYDLLRPPRRSVGGWGAVCLDALFCAAAGILLFSLAMSAGSGRPGTWVLLSALLGFLAYTYTVGRYFLRAFSLTWEKLNEGTKFCEKKLKKLWYFSKLYFQKLKKCFIIKK